MLKRILLITTLYLFGQSNAQTGIYIRPILERSISINKTPDFNLTLLNQDGLPINIQPLRCIFLKGIQPGGYLGYHFNRIFSLETGFIQFTAASGFKYNGYDFKSGYNHYAVTNGRGYTGILVNRIPIRANWTIFRTDITRNKRYLHSLQLNLELAYLFTNRGDPNKVLVESEFVISARDSSLSTVIKEEFSSELNRGFFSTIGLTYKIDNRKGTNLFIFSIAFSKGYVPLSKEIITVYHPGVPKVVHYLGATGTGVYYSISREFNFANYKRIKSEKFKKALQAS